MAITLQLGNGLSDQVFNCLSPSAYCYPYWNAWILFCHRFAHKLQMWLNFSSILVSLAMSVSFFSPYLMVQMIQHIRQLLM